jgi:hypothetical protein
VNKKDNFLRQLESRRKQHLVKTPGHVDGPTEKTIEQLEAETKRAELERLKAETAYWNQRREANSVAADEPTFGLASNQRKYKRMPLPKGSRRPRWK